MSDHNAHIKFLMVLILAILCLGCIVISCGDNNGSNSNEETELQAGKWGFVDRSGEMVIEPRFDEAIYFSEGLAPVKLDGKWGYIDSKGSFIIEPRFESDAGFPFSEGLAPVEVDGKWGYINKKGNMVIEPGFGYAGQFSEGLAEASLVPYDEPGYAVGLIDKEGTWVVEPQFEVIMGFSEGLAAITFEHEGMLGFIDTAGKLVIEANYSSVSKFTAGLAAVSTQDSKCGFINRNGDWAIEPKFDIAGNFSEGYALACVDSLWGFIDKTGNWVIEPQFEGAFNFSESLASVRLSSWERWDT